MANREERRGHNGKEQFVVDSMILVLLPSRKYVLSIPLVSATVISIIHQKLEISVIKISFVCSSYG